MPVAQDVRILVPGLIGLRDLLVIENVITILPITYTPIMPTLHRPLVHHHPHQLVPLLPEHLLLLIQNGLSIFGLALYIILKPVQMNQQVSRQSYDSQLFISQSHVLALETVPGILFI